MMRTKNSNDAMSLLRKDHALVKSLFDRFEKSEDLSEKKEIVREACRELKVHAAIEEQLFYPALRQRMDDSEGLLDEADEEHHEAKILVAELDLMRGGEENYRAKFEVLAENVRHHIKVEEGRIFPKAKKTAIDFNALGERMLELKEELMTLGVDAGPEVRMVEEFGVVQTSPSRAAQRTFTAPITGRKRARKH